MKSFHAPAAPPGGSGIACSVDVTYEPCSTLETRATLRLTSKEGGRYSTPLFGHCDEPVPQGPVTIKPGSSASVAFKNVFNEGRAFVYQVDNPAYQVKAGETLSSKKTTHISVSYKPEAGGGAQNGKLLVMCEGCTPWVWYLRGAQS